MGTPQRVARLAAALAAAGALAALGSAPAAADATPVTATPAQVAAQLFVAGDVVRLSTVPSGTADVVLEKVLQQLYADDPGLAPADAAHDIDGLQAALSGAGPATSPATLAVLSANERILAILQTLEASAPPAPVALAVTEVADAALGESSDVNAAAGSAFDASADTLSTLSLGGFSPARVLEATVALAQGNVAFGQARDAVWRSVSHESVFDDTTQLLAENPALQNGPIGC